MRRQQTPANRLDRHRRKNRNLNNPAIRGPCTEPAPMPTHPRSRSWLGFLLHTLLFVVSMCLFAAAAPARADHLDDVELLLAGDNPVIRINFNVQVQYLRHVPEREGDLVQIFLRVLSSDAAPPITDESWTTPASKVSPRFTVTYPLETGTQTRRLLVQFSSPVRFKARQGRDSRSIEMVLLPSAAPIAKKPAPAPAPMPAPKPSSTPKPTPKPAAEPAVVAKGNFAILLDTFPTPEQAQNAPVPEELAGYNPFVTKSAIADMTLYDRSIGYFGSRESAEIVRERVLKRFPNARIVETAAVATVAPDLPAVPRATPAAPVVSAPGKTPAPTPQEPLGIPVAPPPIAAPGLATPPAPPGKAPPTATVTPSPVAAQPPTASAASAEVELQASQLMDNGRRAILGEKYEDAINAFNQLLVLPPNTQSQEAQELIGLARERIGQVEKAKAEYELYLKLYPEGEGARRVLERIAVLGIAPAEAPKGARQAPEPVEIRAPIRSFYGSFSQYYYDGSTKAETAFNTPTTVDRATLTSKDLSAIVTNADLNARFRSQESDIKLVVRDTNTWSLIDTSPSRNRLDAAYVDYRGLQNPLSLRLGRQNGVSGGILGRFDGAIAGYGLSKNWRVNAVAGTPVDYSIDSKRYFYGLNVDVERIATYWSGNAYVINQMVDGIADRRAVGGEVRFFKSGSSLYSVIDYDTLFDKLNIATLQGTVQTQGLTTFTFLLDQRKAPTLATTNAVFGQPTTSISTLLQTQTEDQLRQQALGLTADVKQVLVSVTTPVSKSWQVGADFRMTNVGPLPAVNDIPATPGTGNIYGYTLQAIGNNLYSKRDFSVISATYLEGATYHGENLAYNNLTGIGVKWTVEPSIHWYTQRDDMDTRINRYSATLKLSYLWKQSISFEGEYDVENSITESPIQREEAVHQFFYLGYRITF